MIMNPLYFKPVSVDLIDVAAPEYIILVEINLKIDTYIGIVGKPS